VIDFHLESRSGVSTYMQIVHQVQRAVRCGVLAPGDRLPSAREVVAALAINPNTVLKAYNELERGDWVTSRAGVGTFVAASAPRPVATAVRDRLVRSLKEWIAMANKEGLDQSAMEAIFTIALVSWAEDQVA
jgi:GntR family transcriptional regulator